MKKTYDIKADAGGFKVDDLVWLYNPKRRRGLSPKLRNSWEGPYKIVKRINDLVYRIHKPPEETKGRPFQQVGPLRWKP
ncbi:hypothetical protein JTB14_035775 [Gonioctena quinquepunctata]|nr:hypothetical protein JTB14_035775 [Gonioctena quinquepunctata]